MGMNTRNFLLSLVVLLVFFQFAQAKRPNVLLIISDDQSWTDLGFMGHRIIETPHLDRLAKQSVTFRRGYVPTALCRPSLATIATGLYPHQHFISGNDPAPLRNARGRRVVRGAKYQKLRNELIRHIDRHPTLPRLLAKNGYRCFQTGKWWEGNHRRGGFTDGMTHGDPKRGGRHGDLGLRIGRQGLKPIYDFIEKDTSKPFFVWYAPFLPHTPHNPPQRLFKKYLNKPNVHPRLAKYYAMCDWFDETCGALMSYLDRKKLTDDTLVVYVTDNGWIQRTPKTKLPKGWRTQFAPRSKQSPYEGGVRTPIMFRWPKNYTARMDNHSLVSSIDLMPTILTACEVKVPQGLPGIDLHQICKNKAKIKRKQIFGESFAHDIVDIQDPSKSLLYRWCIRGKWKLLLTYKGKVDRYPQVHRRTITAPQLFDLHADPHERTNLAKSNPEIVNSLSKELVSWWKVPKRLRYP